MLSASPIAMSAGLSAAMVASPAVLAGPLPAGVNSSQPGVVVAGSQAADAGMRSVTATPPRLSHKPVATLPEGVVVKVPGGLHAHHAVNTTITLTVSQKAIGEHTSATLTAVLGLASNAPVAPTGSVQFWLDGKLRGSAAVKLVVVHGVDVYEAIFTLNTTGMAPANHTITAVYKGDANYNASSTTLKRRLL